MDQCPACGATLTLEFELEVEEETYVGSVDIGGEMKLALPFCNQGRQCNRVIAANVMDELAKPFLERVGNG